MSTFEATFVTDLGWGLSIAFPAAPRLTDATLMQYMVNLTASWDGTAFTKAWPIFLTQRAWRKSETGEISLEASSTFSGEIDPHAQNPRIPYVSAKFPDESEIFNDSDVSRTMKFARDNGWPLHLSCASTFDGTNAITVTYSTGLEDCEDKTLWLWTKFVSLMTVDGLIGFPALARNDITWKRHCFIGDHYLHIMLKEQNVWTTEEDGRPCFYFYGPEALLKLRAETADVADRILTMCYDRPPNVTDEHHGKHWALVASLSEGPIDPKFLAQLREHKTIEEATVLSRETFMQGLVAEPYRIGTGKFGAQFKPEKPYSATIAIEKGVHNEYGTAIFFEQSTRRCLITRRIILSEKETEEDSFWQVMKDWAQFEPRLARPRVASGQLFYPSA
jgi:hypothetical protein